MRLKYLWNNGKQWLVHGLQAVDKRTKSWTQPAPDRAIKGVVSDLFRSRKDLIVENAFLRQQVIVLNRQKQGGAYELNDTVGELDFDFRRGKKGLRLRKIRF